MSGQPVSYIEKAVQSTISSLGCFDNGVYQREPDCYDGIRDLIRHLHNDTRSLLVRRLCNGRNIVKNDLVPIMTSDNITDELFDASLRLTVNLCQPTIIAFGGKMPEEGDEVFIYYEVETYLIRSLAAFLNPKIFEVFHRWLKAYFDQEVDERTEKRKLLTERIVVLLRYVFAIGIEGAKFVQVPEVDRSVQEKVISNFLSSEIPALFMRLCQNSMEKEFCLHTLAVFSLVLKPFSLKDVAIAEADGKAAEQLKKQEEEQLRKKVEFENQKKLVARSQLPTRPFLTGSYLYKGVKALNKKNDLVLTTKPTDDPLSTLSERKVSRKRPRNRRVEDFCESSLVLTPVLNRIVRVQIKQFCHEILESCYNKLMKITRNGAFASARSLTHKYADVYYFSLCRSITEFVRVTKSPSSLVSTTFTAEFFHHIYSQLDAYFESMKTDKHNIKLYVYKAQHAVATYKELIILLHALYKSTKDEDRELILDICKHIFEVEEYRELGCTIMSEISPVSITHSMLEDLVLTNHYYIGLMEKMVKCGILSKIEKRKRIVKRRSTKPKRKKANADATETDVGAAEERNEMESRWQDIACELSDVLIGDIEPSAGVSPMNVLLKVDDDSHQGFALYQVQKSLRERRVCDAVGLYRAARELWSDGIFGEVDIQPEDEFVEMRELFFTDLTEVESQFKEEMKKAYGRAADVDDGEEDVPSVSDSENKDDEDAAAEYNELDEDDEPTGYERYTIPFNFDEYVFVLKDFDRNSKEVNQAVLKLLHRIAFDLQTPSRLYQALVSASLFRIFSQVNELFKGWTKDKLKMHEHFEIYQFGYHLLNKFFAHMKERGDLLVCELLFPKTAKDVYEIEHGYGSLE
ncbi:timeless protein [Aphelenchoides avenae]|nr:timeless protein [Aphelenchus avenae]